MGNKKLQVWLPLLFSLVLIAGMYFGFKLRDNTPSSKGFLRADRKTSMQEVLDLVRLRYVDSVRLDSLQDDAIQEMMLHLDPHSVFIPARDLSDVNEDIRGNFEGIGVEFNIFADTVHVLHVLPEGPSDKAGLQVGDRIIAVNGENIAGKNLSNSNVRDRIRGAGGSEVKLTIERGTERKEVSVKRGTIPLPSLDAAYKIDANTGYFRLNKFSERSYEELARVMDQYKEAGMNKMILDLRGNGGGLLKQAVEIADEFLDDPRLVVYTEGLNAKREEFKTRRPGMFEDGKLVILVDELSASASEVLAGALQDWDRAAIVGRRTFGKGLVQEQFELSDGSAIRLTVARYYTPAGRSIQRPYEKGKKEYMDEIRGRYETGELVNADSNKISNGKSYTTLVKKRTVYGGGGIMPDHFVPIDTSTLSRSISRLVLAGTLNDFLYNYYMKHRNEIGAYRSAAEFNTNYNNLEDLWQALLRFYSTEKELAQISSKDKLFIQKRMKAQLARFRWRSSGYYEVINSDDPAVLKAIEVLK